MVIELIVVGKTTARYLEEGIDEYLARLKHYTKFTYTVIPELKNAKSLRENQIKEAEGELILAKIATSDRLVLLDDKGMKPTSEKMAEWLQEAMNRATRKMVFAVGGAYGFSERVYDRADEKLSLSPLTFSHQMVRLIFFGAGISFIYNTQQRALSSQITSYAISRYVLDLCALRR